MGAIDTESTADSGLACLCVLARLHEVAVSPVALAQAFGGAGRGVDDDTLLRAARFVGLEARRIEVDFVRLAALALPAIAALRDGRYVLLAAVRGQQVLVDNAGPAAPAIVERVAFERVWSGRLIVVTRRADRPARTARFGFAWFVPHLLAYRRHFIEVFVAAFVLQMLALATPLFFQLVIDKVLVHHGLTTLDVLAVGFFVVVLFEAVLGTLRTYVLNHTTSRIDVVLGAALFDHLLRLPLAYFAARRVGDTVARVRELETLRHFITGNAITLVVDAVFTVAYVALMLAYSPTLTLVVLATLPGYALLAALVTPLLRARLEEQFERGADNQAFLVETVTGIDTLKALAVEPEMRQRWEERLAAHVRACFRTRQLASVAGEAAALGNKLMVLGILWLGAREVMAGTLSVGQLVAFNMVAGRITGPLTRLIQLWQDFQQAAVAMRRLGDVLDAVPEPARSAGGTAPPPLRGAVRFEQVAFRYRPDGPLILGELSLHAAPGEIVGIVGHSGSGKSTLAKLIQRLYVPERGRVLIDGVDLALLDPAWLRRQVGVVVQDTVLFNRSVHDNIALAAPGAPLAAVVQAAQLAGAHGFIVELPAGYDTVIGEQGASLSGGQRQRIALARALVTEPRVLVLDEATSALDYAAEVVIQRHMRAICAGRTVFVIAHRLSALRGAHRIIVLERGRIVEQGTPTELRAKGGYFSRLCTLHDQMAAELR